MIMDLQGKFGFKREEVNAHGRVVNEISKVNGTPGKILFYQYQKIYKIIVLIG